MEHPIRGKVGQDMTSCDTSSARPFSSLSHAIEVYLIILGYVAISSSRVGIISKAIPPFRHLSRYVKV
jgi:hypothetical protein